MTTFLEYMRQIEREAEAAGPDAVAQLRTLQLHWRAELAALQDTFQKKVFCTCGIHPGTPPSVPDPRVAWRHLSFCRHSLIER